MIPINRIAYYYYERDPISADIVYHNLIGAWTNTATGDCFIRFPNNDDWTAIGGTSFDLAAAIHASSNLTPPDDADEYGAAREITGVWTLIKHKWSDIKAGLKTYFDTVYSALGHTHAHNDTTSLNTGDYQHLTAAQLAIISDYPEIPEDPTGLFLRDDGTWAAAGGGSSWPLPEFLCTAWSSEGNVGAGFSDRQSCAMCVHNDAIYLAGGDYYTPAYYRDVYKTSDGSTWTQVASAAEFGYRTAAGMVSFGGKLVIIGGKNSGGNLTSVYSSPTGATWTQETADAGIGSVQYVTAAVFDGKIWATGGTTNTVRISSDGGATWSTADGTLAGTNNKRLVVHGDYLYNFAYSPSGGVRVIERRKAGDTSWERVYTLGAWTADSEGASVVSAGSRIFRIGGASDPKYVYSSRLGFDPDIPINGKWRTDMSNTLPYNCAYGEAVQFRGRVYVFFGDYGKLFYSTE